MILATIKSQVKTTRNTPQTRAKAPVAYSTKTSEAPLIAISKWVIDRKPPTGADGPLSPAAGASTSGAPVTTGTRDAVSGSDIDPTGQFKDRP